MPDPIEVHTEPFKLHLEFQWDGGTLAEFETNFQQFSWDVPRFVHFSEPMSGFGAHLALNAFETSFSDHSGDLVRVLAGGIAELHGDGHVDLGVQGQVDFRALQLSGASIYLGVQGQVTANPAGGNAEVTFSPTLSIQFGATAHP